MRIRVLGPAEIVGAGGPSAGSSAGSSAASSAGSSAGLERTPRALLTLLALRVPDAVSVDELAAFLWDDPPATAVRTIQSHVSRLRAALGTVPADADRIRVRLERTGGGGYALRAEPGAVDVGVVAGLRSEARALLAAGRPDDAAGALREARALWRGPVEVPSTLAAAAVAARWDHERRQLVEEHLAALVAGSRPAGAVAELQAATTADPADERAWELLVRALHRSGRTAAAVRAFQDARAALAEIGLEPGPALRRAEADALAAPQPVAPGATTAAGEAAPPVPVLELPGARDVRYARAGVGAGAVDVAWVAIGTGPPDLLLLNPGLISIDGLGDEPRLAAAVGRLAAEVRVLALDRRGTGLSGRGGAPPDLDDWVADAVAVLDAASSPEAVVLAGSDTGLVALALAAAHPARVRGVVLVHGYARFVRAADYPYGFDAGTATAISDEVLAPDAAPGRFDPLAHIAPSVAGDAAFRRWWDALGRRAASPAAAAALHQLIHSADVRDRLAGVAAPVLLLQRRSCASHDVGHARFLAERLAAARFVLLPGADELWFTGDAAPLLDEVLAFAASPPAPAPE